MNKIMLRAGLNLRSVRKVKLDRAVVRSHHIRQYLRVLKPVLQALRHAEIVDAPPRVLRPGAEPVGPPRINPRLIRVKVAECINEARVEKLRELLPLLVSKARILSVRLRVLQVNLLVSHVHVSRHDDRLKAAPSL